MQDILTKYVNGFRSYRRKRQADVTLLFEYMIFYYRSLVIFVFVRGEFPLFEGAYYRLHYLSTIEFRDSVKVFNL